MLIRIYFIVMLFFITLVNIYDLCFAIINENIFLEFECNVLAKFLYTYAGISGIILLKLLTCGFAFGILVYAYCQRKITLVLSAITVIALINLYLVFIYTVI